jgi:hypothetical protein
VSLSSPPLCYSEPSPLFLSRRLPTFASMGVAQRIVDLPARPQTVQEHTELPGHTHHSPFLCVLASAKGYLLPVAPEVRVGAERSQDVVGAANQELTLSISSPSF